MNEGIKKGKAIYVLGEENQAVIGEQGVVMDFNGDLIYVATGKKQDDVGLWLRADELSVEKPVEPEAEADEVSE